MGVVTNEINIKRLQVGVEALPTIMTSVANCVEAVANVQTSVASMKLDINNLKSVTEVTVTPEEKVTIGTAHVYKTGNVINGYVRFTVASDHPGVSDYTMFTLSEAPREIMRMTVFSEWDAAKIGEIAIDASGHVKSGSTSIIKGQLYGAHITFIAKDEA